MALLDRIKELCKKRGISVSALESKLDLPNNTIYQWKSRTPGTDRLKLVADYFNVSTDYLLGRTDTPSLSDSLQITEGETMPTESIGQRINYLRKLKDISMKSLSEQITNSTGIKVSPGQISDWENGNKTPSADGLIALSTFFEASIDWLLTGDNQFGEPRFETVNNMSYKDLLKTYIESSGLSLREIEEQMRQRGFSTNKAYISKLQNGVHPPAGEDITRALAEITGGNSEELLMAAFIDKAPQEVKKLREKQKGLSGIRSELKIFVEQMQQALNENDFKGGWENETFDYFCEKLHSTLHKLTSQRLEANPNWQEVIKQSVNLANYAMMIADHAQKQESQYQIVFYDLESGVCELKGAVLSHQPTEDEATLMQKNLGAARYEILKL